MQVLVMYMQLYLVMLKHMLHMSKYVTHGEGYNFMNGEIHCE